LAPCSVFDSCDDHATGSHQTEQAPKKDCTHCPPFCGCSAVNGLPMLLESSNPLILVVDLSGTYGEYNFSSKTEYYFTHFEPPRSGNC
jgi:hypothetical protein